MSLIFALSPFKATFGLVVVFFVIFPLLLHGLIGFALAQSAGEHPDKLEMNEGGEDALRGACPPLGGAPPDATSALARSTSPWPPALSIPATLPSRTYQTVNAPLEKSPSTRSSSQPGAGPTYSNEAQSARSLQK